MTWSLWLGLLSLAAAPLLIHVALSRRTRVSRFATPMQRPLTVRGPGRVPPLDRLGRRLRLIAGRPSNAAHDRRLGAGAVAAALCAVFAPALLPASLVMPVASAVFATRKSARDRDRSLIRQLPEVVDLYVVALASGHSIATATRQVAARGQGLVVDALTAAVDRVDRGMSLDSALEGLRTDIGPRVRPLTSALLDGLRYGVPVADSLSRVAVDLRLERRRSAEQQARRLPVVMLFPLVFCVLPAFALLTVVPVLVDSLQSLVV